MCFPLIGHLAKLQIIFRSTDSMTSPRGALRAHHHLRGCGPHASCHRHESPVGLEQRGCAEFSESCTLTSFNFEVGLFPLLRLQHQHLNMAKTKERFPCICLPSPYRPTDKLIGMWDNRASARPCWGYHSEDPVALFPSSRQWRMLSSEHP